MPSLNTTARTPITHVHTLGPSGTNLEAAAHAWLTPRGGGEVVLHASLESAIPLIPRTGTHALLACAVYPDLHTLVFSNLAALNMIDSFLMPTHNMVLASSGTTTPKIVATHRAPSSLVPDETDKRIVLSNAQAAIDCADGLADGCITTIVAARQRNLKIIHDFGPVPMIFTVHQVMPDGQGGRG
ncbi:hypothetical protein [Nonomuraea rubra]|uniref:hypothetical protein n=1 Tax=Nonomuraea rubra TaxID=46180 RepID=UPI0033D5A5F2